VEVEVGQGQEGVGSGGWIGQRSFSRIGL
jgi:hypothetical protein